MGQIIIHNTFSANPRNVWRAFEFCTYVQQLFNMDEIKSYGVRMVVFAHQTTLAAFAAVSDIVKQLSKINSLSELNTKMASMEDLFKLQGMQKITEHESFVEEEIKKMDL